MQVLNKKPTGHHSHRQHSQPTRALIAQERTDLVTNRATLYKEVDNAA